MVSLTHASGKMSLIMIMYNPIYRDDSVSNHILTQLRNPHHIHDNQHVHSHIGDWCQVGCSYTNAFHKISISTPAILQRGGHSNIFYNHIMDVHVLKVRLRSCIIINYSQHIKFIRICFASGKTWQ